MTTPFGAPTPVPGPTPFDTGNMLLGEQPAQFSTTAVNTPHGGRLAATVRTPSTTVTIFLTKEDALKWAAQFRQNAEAMSSSGLIAASGNGAPPKPPARGRDN